ncbi:phage tail tape measure protein [Actinoplanes sp. N902-109]|uniref:phage tail tape measure protein n=1 Tax=Actinoplanes sp. (strain N902-109) TaxID=649831 RepID=UPI0003295876|nr:phage tail tape measure protein [Actinoplanes sp. N902-109]AGL13884.1 phage tail tape measure protein, TP901 family [Actinoplanes sp. N902-109]
MALRTIGIKLTADISQYTANMRRAEQTTQGFHSKLSQAASSGKLDAIADRAGVMGLAVGGGFAMAVKSAADFDKQMSSVRAATHASAGDMDQLRQAAIKAGADTQYSATEAGKGIEELSKAGVATSDILGGGLNGALSLAAAGELDVGEAAETAASAMTQFKLKGNQVPHVADLLAAAAGKAQGSVHDMGAALNQTGLVAAQTGLTIEETTGGLAAFASAGLTGSDAGTSFKQMLLMLQAPSDKTKGLMDELGISLYDQSGKFIGLTKFAGQLQEKLRDLTPEARAAAMAQIFGADATRAASILYENGAKGIQEWIDKTNDAGYASETAAMKTDNLAGDIERLKGSLDTLLIQSGSGASGGLRVITQTLNTMVDQFGKLPPGISQTITVLGGLTAAVLLGGAAWVKARSAIGTTIAELNAVGPAGARAATALRASAKGATIAAVAFIGLEAVGAVFDKLGASAVNVDKLTDSLQNYASTGKLSGEVVDRFGAGFKDFGKAADAADAANHGFWGGFNDALSSIPGINSAIDSVNESIYGMSFNQAKEDMDGLDQSFTQFIGTQKDAKVAGDLWNQMLSNSSLSTEQLAALLPNAWKALQELQKNAHAGAGAQKDLAGATGGTTEKTKEYATAADAAAAAANGQREALSDLASKMKAETDPVFGLLNAQRELKKAQDAAAAAIKKNGRNSAEAKEATQKLAEAAIELQNKTGALSQSFDGKLSPSLRATFKAAGLTDKQIRTIEGSFQDARKSAEKYDDKYAAQVSAPGAPKAKTQLDAAHTAASKYAGKYTAQVVVAGDAAAYKKMEKLLVAQQAAKKGISISAAQSAFNKNAYATGGWTGPGAMYDPAGIVHADEYVIKKPSRRKFEQQHPGVLDHINTLGELPPGYATGGRVWPFRVDASHTKVMSMAEALSKVIAAAPSGGMTYKWILDVVGKAFPGLGAISTYRPGAITLTGHRSYHADGRAVDFPPSKALAEWVNAHYFRQTKELITPWNSLNIKNGARHRYTGAVWNQHNFAGGNAHDHWAMANGGLINEPIVGVGASGRTYSFGEYGPERVTPGMGTWQSQGGGAGMTVQNSYQISVQVPATANQAEVGRAVVGAIQAYEQRSGASWRKP